MAQLAAGATSPLTVIAGFSIRVHIELAPVLHVLLSSFFPGNHFYSLVLDCAEAVCKRERRWSN